MGKCGTVAIGGQNLLQHCKLKATSNCGIKSRNKLWLQFGLVENIDLAQHLKPLCLQHFVYIVENISTLLDLFSIDHDHRAKIYLYLYYLYLL